MPNNRKIDFLYFPLVLLICLYACDNSRKQTASKTFQKHIPDTTNNWYAQLFDYPYYLKKTALAKQLKLYPLENGRNSFEMRLWSLASSYNPQSLYVVTGAANRWKVLHYIFYMRPKTWDNPIIDSQTVVQLNPELATAFINTANIMELWKYKSQSEMPKGNSYGCMDGSSILLEMADKDRYKYTFYNCPDINASRDSIFRRVAYLYEGIGNLRFQ